MGKLFEAHYEVNWDSTKYSFNDWNRVDLNNERERAILTNLVSGNFYYFMNHLLDFRHSTEGTHPWVSRRKR